MICVKTKLETFLLHKSRRSVKFCAVLILDSFLLCCMFDWSGSIIYLCLHTSGPQLARPVEERVLTVDGSGTTISTVASLLEQVGNQRDKVPEPNDFCWLRLVLFIFTRIRYGIHLVPWW